MSAFKPVEAYACSTMTMMAEAIAEHRAEFGGALPRLFVLHRASIHDYEQEHFKRYRVLHHVYMPLIGKTAPAFLGVPIAECTACSPECEDVYMNAKGGRVPL